MSVLRKSLCEEGQTASPDGLSVESQLTSVGPALDQRDAVTNSLTWNVCVVEIG